MVASDALFVFVLCPLNTVASLGETASTATCERPGDTGINFFVGEFRKNTGQMMSGVATRRQVRKGQQFAEGR